MFVSSTKRKRTEGKKAGHYLPIKIILWTKLIKLGICIISKMQTFEFNALSADPT